MYRRRGRRTIRRRRRRTSRRRPFTRRVRRVVQAMAEKKYIDIEVTGGIGTSGFLVNLCAPIANGSASSQRVGNKIMIRYIMWRFDLDSENEDGIYWRIALLRGRTAGLTISDVPTGSNAASAFLDIEKWDIRSDKTFSFGDADTNGMNKRLYRHTCRIMKSVIYDNATLTTAVVNNFYMYGWSNDVITTGVNIRGFVRVYYTDI